MTSFGSNRSIAPPSRDKSRAIDSKREGGTARCGAERIETGDNRHRVATANDTAFDVPPPGAGLNTVTFAVPAVAMSATVIWAVSCVLLTYVVVRSNRSSAPPRH